jgi:phage terminase large subunit GpA-like protein
MVTTDYTYQISELFEAARFQLSDTLPSEWGEQNRLMTPDVSPLPGKLSYRNSPYTRDIVDCLAPSNPARIIAVMKGAQIGFSTTVIETGIGWIMSQNPGNIMFLVGHDDLVEEAIAKVDRMIDNTGIRKLIKPTIQRKKNMKTGDTNRSKEFPNGSLVSGTPSNHKLLRNRSIQYGFIDDFEAAKNSSKQSGSTAEMIEQRFAAYVKKMKLYYISTPELKQGSNIEPQYLLGDQRKYHIPCPCCGELINIEWSIKREGTEEMAGITWKLTDENELISGSVGYICQKCGGFFDDKQKDKLLLAGEWIPTAKPSQEGFVSFHISSLYAPSYMYDWEHYVRKYLQACPVGQKRNEKLWKTFKNLVLGETYEDQGEDIKANDLQRNIRPYEINIVPEKLSIKDGNGKIVMLTCAADMNGVVEDARLDYEVVAWSESGSSYSIVHGSIGTFIPRENTIKNKVDRERFTYEHGKANSVWPLFTRVIDQIFDVDTGRRMKISITGLDTGHYTTSYAYPFIDNTNHTVVGLKGKDENKYIKFGVDIPNFHVAKERANLYTVEVNQLKDNLAELIRLKYDERIDDFQPIGFMNFPTPSQGLYLLNNYFSHYEAEQRIVEESKDGQGIASRWQKKNTIVQNHFFDCRIYNMVLRDITVWLFCKFLKMQKLTWSEYVNLLSGKN